LTILFPLQLATSRQIPGETTNVAACVTSSAGTQNVDPVRRAYEAAAL
jgi:hypothetical protein